MLFKLFSRSYIVRLIIKHFSTYSAFPQKWFTYLPLHEKCPYSQFFWSVFSRIWTENFEYGYFSCGAFFTLSEAIDEEYCVICVI